MPRRDETLRAHRKSLSIAEDADPSGFAALSRNTRVPSQRAQPPSPASTAERLGAFEDARVTLDDAPLGAHAGQRREVRLDRVDYALFGPQVVSPEIVTRNFAQGGAGDWKKLVLLFSDVFPNQGR